MKITKKTTSNRYNGRAGWVPDMIVCHTADGTYEGTILWIENQSSEVSSHYVVAKDGRVTQMVDLKDGAWCNGTSTVATKNSYYAKSSLEVVRQRKANANYYTVSIEFEGFWKDTKGRLTDAQFSAAADLIRQIRAEVKAQFGVDIPIDREHIVGHHQISPVTRPNCPGELFQWDALIDALKADAPPTPDEPDYKALFLAEQTEHHATKAALESLKQGIRALL